MDTYSRGEILDLLHVAWRGFELSAADVQFLQKEGWAKSMTHESIAALRRSRQLDRELVRLEDQRRNKTPSGHLLSKLADTLPWVRQQSLQEMDRLNAEISDRNVERKCLDSLLTPAAIQDGGWLKAYRSVSQSDCVRLTDRACKELLLDRFSESYLPDHAMFARLGSRIERMERTYRELESSAWWRQRADAGPMAIRAKAKSDGLWLAAVLSRFPEDANELLARARESFLALQSPLRLHDPLPLCLLSFSHAASPPIQKVVEANNRLFELGWGVGVDVFAAGMALLIGGTPSRLDHAAAEYHSLLRLLMSLGISFSASFLPSAARLVGAQRPVERTGHLFCDLENKTNRMDRMNDQSSRTAAAILADLPLDYTDRPGRADLFQRDDPYTSMLAKRYRIIRSAFTESGSKNAAITVQTALLALCPGTVEQVIDTVNRVRQELTLASSLPYEQDLGLAAMLIDSLFDGCRAENHTRFVWELYFASSR